MKTFRLICLLSILAGWSATARRAAAQGAPAPAADKSTATAKQNLQQAQAARFKEVEDKIAILYRHRNDPKPDFRANPFRAPGSVAAPAPTVAEGGKLPEGADPASVGPGPGASLALLQQGAATLKVSGNFEIGGVSYLVINSRHYKEGDVVQTQVQGETVYLRVKEIARRSVTLSLNDAEMTLKY